MGWCLLSVWGEAVLVCFTTLFRHFHRGTEENLENRIRISSIWAKIRVRDMPNDK
jgi:hypothetical protein